MSIDNMLKNLDKGCSSDMLVFAKGDDVVAVKKSKWCDRLVLWFRGYTADKQKIAGITAKLIEDHGTGTYTHEQAHKILAVMAARFTRATAAATAIPEITKTFQRALGYMSPGFTLHNSASANQSIRDMARADLGRILKQVDKRYYGTSAAPMGPDVQGVLDRWNTGNPVDRYRAFESYLLDVYLPGVFADAELDVDMDRLTRHIRREYGHWRGEEEADDTCDKFIDFVTHNLDIVIQEYLAKNKSRSEEPSLTERLMW